MNKKVVAFFLAIGYTHCREKFFGEAENYENH